jgi:hypothetical protein
MMSVHFGGFAASGRQGQAVTFFACQVKFICSRIKKAKAEGSRCHAKTMMNTKADKAQTSPLIMCRLGK